MGRRYDGGGNRNLLGDVVKGAIAGAVGMWAMERVTWYLYDREDPQALQQEHEARVEGKDPAHVLANRTARTLGTRLQPEQPHPAGMAVHFGLGIGSAMLYAPLRRRVPAVSTAGGMLYGLGLFLAMDEGLAPALGLASSPAEYPWQAHARGLAGHLALGAATNATLELLDRLA